MLKSFKPWWAGQGAINKLIIAFLSLSFLVFIGFSFFLRPVADSYVYAQAVAMFNGPLGATAVWWEYNSPMVVKEFMAFLFVGSPLLVMPWWLSSSFAFIVNGLLLAGALYSLGVINNFKTSVYRFIIFAFAVNVLWMTYWFTYGLIYNPERVTFISRMMESSSAHLGMFYEAMDYQIGVMSYVGSTSLIIILFSLANKYRRLASWRGYLIVFIVSVVSSLASLTLTAVLLSLWLIYMASYNLLKSRLKGLNFNFKHISLIVVGNIVTLAISLSSPGSIMRSDNLNININHMIDAKGWSGNNYIPKDFVDSLGYTLTHTLMDVKFMLINLGSLLFIFISLGVGYLLARFKIDLNREQAFNVGIVSILAGLITNAVVAYSHLKVYTASWHQMLPGFFYFTGLLCLGLWISGLDFKRMNWARPLAAVGVIAISAGMLFSYSQHAVEREDYWNKGSVNSAFSPDVYLDWAIYAWDTVLEVRGEEDFRNIPPASATGLESSMYDFIWKIDKSRMSK